MFQTTALVQALVKSRAQRSTDVLAPVRQNLRAWPWLCDRLGHVNNARYLDLLSLGRAEWLASMGLLRPVVFNGYSFIVAGVNAIYRRAIPRLAPFSMETRVAGYDDRWAYYEQTFYLEHDQRGNIAAKFLTCGQLNHRRERVSPSELMERFGVAAPPSPALDATFEAWTKLQRLVLSSIQEHDQLPP